MQCFGTAQKKKKKADWKGNRNEQQMEQDVGSDESTCVQGGRTNGSVWSQLRRWHGEREPNEMTFHYFKFEEINADKGVGNWNEEVVLHIFIRKWLFYSSGGRDEWILQCVYLWGISFTGLLVPLVVRLQKKLLNELTVSVCYLVWPTSFAVSQFQQDCSMLSRWAVE